MTETKVCMRPQLKSLLYMEKSFTEKFVIYGEIFSQVDVWKTGRNSIPKLSV